MIVFPKGAWYALDAACDMGYNVVGLDWLHSPEETLKIVGDRPITIQGNADPGVLYGSHASITEVVQEMVKGYDWANRKKGWIVNLGHGKSSASIYTWPPLTNSVSQESHHLSTQRTCGSSFKKSIVSPRRIEQ